MIKVEITGFKSLEDAREFIKWYEMYGEDHSQEWQMTNSPDSNWYTAKDSDEGLFLIEFDDEDI